MTGTRPPIDYTAVDFDSLDRALRDLAARNLPEYTDQSDNDLGALFRQYVAYAADIALYYQTRIAQNLMPATADDPVALAQLLRWIGYERQPASAASTELELGFAATAVPPINLPKGLGFVYANPTGEMVRFELTRALSITGAQLGPADPARENLRYFTPASVIEGRTTSGEVLGQADGAANQIYALAQPDVLPGSVGITVAEAGGPRRWQAVISLLDSGPTDRHFVVQRAADGIASVLFGDDVNGLAPPAGPPAAPTTLTAGYRTGGGLGGNIPAGAILRCEDARVRAAVAIRAAGGGREAEPLEAARRMAPRLFRAQDRAVSTADHEDLAVAVPGVGKAKAVAAGWNTIALFIAPEGVVGAPSETLRAEIVAALAPRRMLGTDLRLFPPDAVDVFVRARVRPNPFMPRETVRADVVAAVEAFFAFDAIAFGEPLYLSRLYDGIQSLPGVDFLFIDRFAVTPGGGVDGDGVIELAPWQLPRPGANAGGLPLELLLLTEAGS